MKTERLEIGRGGGRRGYPYIYRKCLKFHCYGQFEAVGASNNNIPKIGELLCKFGISSGHEAPHAPGLHCIRMGDSIFA